jgi:hypothetical protein
MEDGSCGTRMHRGDWPKRLHAVPWAPFASAARRLPTATSSKPPRLWKTGWLTPLNPSGS